MSHRSMCFSLFALLIVAAVPAVAVTYVPMDDGALADSAPVIVEVQVIDASTATVGGKLFTDYQVAVQRVVKGSIAGNTLVVRVLGGRSQHGISLEIQGAPKFRSGERALVFLSPSEDGTYLLSQFSLGAFHVVDRGTRTYAYRDLSSAQPVALPGRLQPVRDGLREYGEFRDWLQNRAAGIHSVAGYFRDLPASELQAISDGFTWFRDLQTGGGFRWQEFDAGQPVVFFAQETGQPGLAGGGFQEFQDALAAWNADPDSNINLQYGGTTSLSGGLLFPCDDVADCTVDLLVSAIAFDDPNDNLLIFGNPFSCTSGGVIAAGGPWFISNEEAQIVHEFRGRDFVTILAADIVTNKNVGCFLSQGNSAREVFSHELGHTLGLGHACADQLSGACNTTAKDEALMRALAHGDGRGAQLGSDDRAAIRALYANESTGSCEEDEFTLCLNQDRFKVEIDWQRPSGERGLGHGVELTGDTGYFWFFNPANVEMVIKVLNGCSSTFNSYWVFAGGLTNVEANITVTDTLENISRTYTNPLRTPFQPIQDTEAFLTCP